MDKAIRKNILLGLFIITGIVLFIIGIFLIGSKNELFKKTFTITAKFTNATGLKAGSNIRFNGVKVGIVKSVALISDTVVQVDMLIEESKHGFITNAAIASIASDGLMGDKIVNIVTGKNGGEPLHNGELIKSHNPMVTDQILQTLSTTNENVKVISENLKKLTSDLNSEDGTIQELYKDKGMALNLKNSFSNLNLVTNKVLAVGSSLQDIAKQIQDGNGLAGEILKDTVMGKELSYTMNRLKETSDQLIGVSSQLSLTMQHANSGKGAVNMILTDTTFATGIQQSMAHIKSASENLDQDMKALKHSFLIRGYFRKQERKNKKNNDK